MKHLRLARLLENFRVRAPQSRGFYRALGFRRARTFSVAEEAWEGASLELSELVRAVVTVDDESALD